MRVTETAALTKWCPFARGWTTGPQGEPVTANRDGTDIDGNPEFPVMAHCIGSRCMAWTWFDTHSGEGRTGVCGLAHPH
jgi:hypothetical protein